MKSLQDRLMSATRFSSDIQSFEIQEVFSDLRNIRIRVKDYCENVCEILEADEECMDCPLDEIGWG